MKGPSRGEWYSFVPVTQSEQAYELSKRRREVWLSRLKRDDIKPRNYPHTRVCSDHFVTGVPSKLSDEHAMFWP